MATQQQSSIVSDVTSVSLSSTERLYVQRSLDLLITALERSVKKELPGSDFVTMREKEINMLRDLKTRVGARNA